jgi:calcium/calmodulin-dependent protein kinase I
MHCTCTAHTLKVSPEAKDLISKMLVVDTAKRWNCDQLLAHPWVVSTDVSDKQLGSAMAELKKFNARRKFKGAVQVFSGMRVYLVGCGCI